MVNIHDLLQRKTPAERGSAVAGNLIKRAERLAAHCYSSITAARSILGLEARNLAKTSDRKSDPELHTNEKSPDGLVYCLNTFSEAFSANRFSLAESVSPTEARATMVVVSRSRAAFASTTVPRRLSSRQACYKARSISDSVSGR